MRILKWAVALAAVVALMGVASGAAPLEPKAQVGVRLEGPLLPLDDYPGEVLEGTPRIKSRVYSTSLDGTVFGGVWECTGPTKLRWSFAIDEALYIHEGSMTVEYGGQKHVLKPGDYMLIPAGAKADLTVEDRVLKSFTLEEPGRVRRLLRSVL